MEVSDAYFQSSVPLQVPKVDTDESNSVGGHALGSAYEMLYEPDGLVTQAASDGKPLIFVAINYRLGRKSMKLGRLNLVPSEGLADNLCSLWFRDQ